MSQTYRLPSKELEHMFSLYLQASKAYNEISYHYELIANNPGIVSVDRANLVKEALFQAEILRYKVWLKLMEQQVLDSNKYATIS
jgi:hypothetical protein